MYTVNFPMILTRSLRAEPVTMATVKVLGAQPIANHTFNLTCETTGSVYSVHWMRDQLPLYPDSMRVFSMDNSTLTFSPVLLSDNGHYQCSATNPLSQMNSSNYTLMVNCEYRLSMKEQNWF